jgi:hypothetical protein
MVPGASLIHDDEADTNQGEEEQGGLSRRFLSLSPRVALSAPENITMSSLGRVSRSRRAAASSSSAAAPSATTSGAAGSRKAAGQAASNKKRKAVEDVSQQQQQPPPPPPPPPSSKSTSAKASKPSKSSLGPGSSSSKKKKAVVALPHAKLATLSDVVRDRLNPTLRGVHEDAIQVGIAPTSASTCVDCGRPIHKGEMRWGIKYGGNPLPLPVVPLYGHMPMVMWCHGPSSSSTLAKGGFCGLALVRIQDHHSDSTSEAWVCDASRTCHICSDAPDDDTSSSIDGNHLRVLCGGSIGERGKIREHAFHIQCWKSCLIKGSANFNHEQRQLLESAMNHPESPKQWKRHSTSSAVFDKVLAYQDLSDEEKAAVRRELDL